MHRGGDKRSQTGQDVTFFKQACERKKGERCRERARGEVGIDKQQAGVGGGHGHGRGGQQRGAPARASGVEAGSGHHPTGANKGENGERIPAENGPVGGGVEEARGARDERTEDGEASVGEKELRSEWIEVGMEQLLNRG